MRGRAHRAGTVICAICAITLAAGSLGAACHRTFACTNDAECRLDGRLGACEPGGCSFLDPACDSGRRYGEHARLELAGRCVAPEGSGDTSTSGTTVEPGSDLDPPATTAATTDTTDTTGPLPPGDPCVDGLRESSPVVATADGQVIEGLRITSDGEPGVLVEGLRGVTIRDCEIHHRNGPGIVFRDADELLLERVVVIHDGAPPAGSHANGDQVNVSGSDSDDVVLEHVRVVAGSSGIELERTPAVRLSFIEGHDVRGPGEAACVHLAQSDMAVLEDFSCENPLDTARPLDVIEIDGSSDVIVRRGLLDGNNAEYGYGVHFSQVIEQHHGGLVEDVDAIRMTNGSFSCFPYGTGITFRRTRARQNICEIVSIEIPGCDTPGPRGGCIPGSGGVTWAGSLNSTALAIEDSRYFALCSEPVWPTDVFMTPPEQLLEEDFELRPPIRTTACWQ